ncbi:MAG TPA: sensor histidine kinase [Streptosporangiaceae bacterium]
MAAGWTQRLASAPHAVAIAGTVLALAALGQAVAQAVMLTAARAGQTAPGSTAGEAVSLCLLALATTVPLIFLRPAAAAAAITAASTVSLAVFGSGALTVAGVAAQVLASYRLGYEGVYRDAGLAGGDRRDRTPVLACGLAVPFLVLALDGRGIPAILLAVLVPATAWAGIAQRARGEAARQATAREVMAGTLADHMARGERARIARELHDVVAHHISMIAVQAETARETTPGLPAAGAQRLAEIAGTARAGLTEMRRLLGVLREDGDGAAARHPQPGLPQLAELVDAARETSGAGARLIVSGPVAAFDPGVELAAFRIVQEALTNARRHAPGTAVDVELRYGEGSLLLQVRDNGPGPPADHRADGNGHDGAGSPGHGLTGMRERATAAGGSLRTAAAPGGGFLVEATLPAKPELA